MNQQTALTSGVTSSCSDIEPLSLPKIQRLLLHMQARAKQQGELSSADARLYERILEAWQFYKSSQPIHFQCHVEQMIDHVSHYPVGR